MVLPALSAANMSCERNPEVTNWFIRIQHSTVIISIPLSVTALICIIRASPWETRNFKAILLTYQISLIFVDILLTVLIVPDFLFPILGGYPLGFLRYTNVPSLFQLVFACSAFLVTTPYITCVLESFRRDLSTVMFASLAHMFLHRHQMALPIGNRRRLSNKSRRVAVFFLYSFPQGCVFFCSFLVPKDFTKIKEIVAGEHNCFPMELFFEGTVVVDRVTAMTIAKLVSFMLIGSILTISAMVIDTFRALNVASYHMSHRSQIYILRSMRTLILQCIIPHLFALIPISLFVFITFANIYNQVLVQSTTVLLSFHSTVSTMALIFLNSGYRKFVLQYVVPQSNISRVFVLTQVK